MRAWIAAAAVLATGLPARADERHFTYSYEAQTHPKGALEVEQWATLRARKESGHFDVLELRHELEYGVTDTLTTSLYLNWDFEAVRGVPGLENKHEAEFETVSNEWKYKLTDPSVDPLGSLLYVEWALGSEEMELELKGVLSKHWGDFTFAYNLVVELEREKEEEPGGEEEWERGSLLSHTFGASYRANPHFAVGLEGVTRQGFEGGFKEQETLGYFAGPNLHVAAGNWWATLTALRQVDLRGEGHGPDLDAFERYEVRLIFGIEF